MGSGAASGERSDASIACASEIMLKMREQRRVNALAVAVERRAVERLDETRGRDVARTSPAYSWIIATASISTSAPSGSDFTANVARAGGFSVNRVA